MDSSTKIVCFFWLHHKMTKAKKFLLRSVSWNWKLKSVCHVKFFFPAHGPDHLRWQKQGGRWQGWGGEQWFSAPARKHAVQAFLFFHHIWVTASSKSASPSPKALPPHCFLPHMLCVMAALVTHRPGCHTAWCCERGEAQSYEKSAMDLATWIKT